jgi:pyridoxal phosphate enzyme (YggS family)
MTFDASSVAIGMVAVRERIAAAGGDPDRVRVVAVTKGFGPEAPLAALEAGIVHLGENYAQELVAKAAVVGDEPAPVWHFIGGLQSNKVRLLAPYVALWETIDRASLGAEVAKRAPGAAVLAQVNISGEAAKSGCDPEEAADLVARLGDLGLEVRGLMGVAAAGDLDRARSQFGRLATLASALDLAELSMGMSADLEAAVAEGATIVRVGTALFGARPPR